jgi:hypothetical protein
MRASPADATHGPSTAHRGRACLDLICLWECYETRRVLRRMKSMRMNCPSVIVFVK